jgi:cytochrome c biogenesis protein CcmG/thiol:disulfide interchange protein DsbE
MVYDMRRGAADLQAAWNYYQSQDNVIFIGVDYMDSEQKAIAYIEKYNITYPNAPDTGGWVSSSFRVRGVPETFVIDPSGKIASIKIGPYSSLAEIQAAIDPLLTQ